MLYQIVAFIDMILGWLVDDAFSDLAEDKARVAAAEKGRDAERARLTAAALAARQMAVKCQSEPVAPVPVPQDDAGRKTWADEFGGLIK